MSQSYFEYRICLADRGDGRPEHQGPYPSLMTAERDLPSARGSTSGPPYDEAWIERRAVSDWERMRSNLEFGITDLIANSTRAFEAINAAARQISGQGEETVTGLQLVKVLIEMYDRAAEMYDRKTETD